jgi:hypothetical protein
MRIAPVLLVLAAPAVPFCRVCQAAISRIIDLYSRGPAR